jgi:hypothetical protein
MGADEERTLARLPPIAVMPSSYFEPLSFETAGSLICLNTRLALAACRTQISIFGSCTGDLGFIEAAPDGNAI